MRRSKPRQKSATTEITSESLLEILRSKVIKPTSTLKLPSKAAIKQLAVELRYLRFTWNNQHPEEDLNIPIKAMLEAAEYLEPKLRHEIAKRDLTYMKSELQKLESLPSPGETHKRHLSALRYCYDQWILLSRIASAASELLAVEADRAKLHEAAPEVFRNSPNLAKIGDVLPYLCNEFDRQCERQIPTSASVFQRMVQYPVSPPP